MFLYVSIICSFLLMNSISLYGCSIVYLPIDRVLAFLVFELIMIKFIINTHILVFLGPVISSLLGFHLRVGFLGYILNICLNFQFSSVTQSCLDSVTPWTAACQASLSITNSRSLLKLMSIESVMPSNHPSCVVPFSSCL